MSTEHLLLEQLKQGNEHAFRSLVDNWYPKVLNLCMNYLHDAEEAEDIAQDVFVEVFESVKRFRGDASVSTWIYRMAVNKSLNRKKKLQRSRLLFPFAGKGTSDKSHTPVSEKEDHTFQAPDVALEQRDDREAIQRALDKLPPQQRTAFLLSKTEMMPYKEIADIMGTTIPSVESLLFRARTNLRKYLNQYMIQKS
jgi:RNA polymerase sigma-70 factor (ECF subfamily)